MKNKTDAQDAKEWFDDIINLVIGKMLETKTCDIDSEDIQAIATIRNALAFLDTFYEVKDDFIVAKTVLWNAGNINEYSTLQKLFDAVEG